jgi:hypothetical protein
MVGVFETYLLGAEIKEPIYNALCRMTYIKHLEPDGDQNPEYKFLTTAINMDDEDHSLIDNIWSGLKKKYAARQVLQNKTSAPRVQKPETPALHPMAIAMPLAA